MAPNRPNHNDVSDSIFRRKTKVFGVEFAPLLTPFERRKQTASTLLFCSMCFILPFGPLLFCLLVLFNFPLAVLYAGWMYYDTETRNKGGRGIESVRDWNIWETYKSYFPLKMVKTAELDTKRNYLFGAHPHGLFCVGPFGQFGTSREFKKLYPKMSPHLLTLDILFWFPFTRELCLTFGACPATKKSMNYLLSYPKGGKVGILLPGGVPEMLETRENTEVVAIKNRKGFIKIALQNGSPLVPVYSFGENNVYRQLENPQGSLIRKFQLICIKFIGFYIPLVFGRGILQYSYGLLPQRLPITTVVGAPIEVENTPNPTKEQIDKLHEKYITELKALFYNHRERCGYAKAELEIIE